jgi:hypothetical protein
LGACYSTSDFPFSWVNREKACKDNYYIATIETEKEFKEITELLKNQTDKYFLIGLTSSETILKWKNYAGSNNSSFINQLINAVESINAQQSMCLRLIRWKTNINFTISSANVGDCNSANNFICRKSK